MPGSATVRERRLYTGNEFQQACLPVFRGPLRPKNGVADIIGIFDTLAPAAEFAGDSRVISAEISRVVFLVAQLHVRDLDRHRRIVEHDRAHRNACSRSRLDIETESCREMSRPRADLDFSLCDNASVTQCRVC